MNHIHMACAVGTSGAPADCVNPRNRSGSSFFPRLRKSFLPASLLAVFFATEASAADYYVDSISGLDTNNGTSISTPWQTLTKVNGVMFVAGDNVFFKRGGSWTGTLYPKIDTSNILAGSGTSPTNRITFDAYGSTGLNPLIDGGGASWAVQIVDKQYFTFQNFRITNNAATDGPRIGIRVAFGGTGTPLGSVYTFHDVKILNNEIFNVRGITVRSQGVYDNSGGIYVQMMDYLGAQTQVDSLLIEGNDLHDNRCIGLHVKAPANYNNREDLWATNLVIRYNVFDQGGADHIIVNGATGALIEGNAGYDAGILESPNAGSYIAGMWSAYHTRDILFQFNEVARTRNGTLNGVSGDSQAFDADLGTLGYHTFQYNYTHENEGGVLILMPDPTRSKVAIYRYNISVNDARNTNTGCQFAMHPYPGLSSAYVYNNVFYSTLPEGFKLRDYAGAYYYNNIFYMPAAIYPSSPVFSNNAYYGHNPDVNDPYKVLADPKFVGPLPSAAAADGYLLANTGIFKLQSASPCINAGMAISTPVSNGGADFWGNPLYAGGYADIGAHEVGGGSAPAPLPVTFVDNPAGASVTYTGTWTHSADDMYYNSTKSVSSSVGAYVQHTFTGTNAGVYGAKGPDMGMVNINVDGGAPVVVDCYWPVPLYRTLLQQFSGLPNSAHTIRATVTTKNAVSTANTVVIDYFQHDPGTPPTDPIVTMIDSAPGTSAVYNGAWTHSTTNTNYYAKTSSTSATIGNYADFSFNGTGVRLFGTKASSYGKINISVDGGSATLVNCYQPTITDYQVRLFEVTNLAPGPHALRVTVATKDAASSGNTVAVDLVQALSGIAGPVDIIMDNTDSTGITITGAWFASTSVPAYYGANAIHDGNTDKTSNKSVRYTPTIPSTGTYEVFARWPAYNNRSTDVPIDIISASGTATYHANQVDPSTNGVWVSMGTYTFNAGTSGSVLIRAGGTTGFVFADAVRFTKQQPVEIIVDNSDPTGVTLTGAWSASTTTPGYYSANALNDGNTGQGTKSVRFTPTLPSAGTYQVYAWWPALSNRSDSVPFDIVTSTGTVTVNVNQKTNGSQWYSLGTYTFNAGTTGNVLIRNAYTGTGTPGYVIADAMRFVRP